MYATFNSEIKILILEILYKKANTLMFNAY